jgi:high-affinity iron transporter
MPRSPSFRVLVLAVLAGLPVWRAAAASQAASDASPQQARRLLTLLDGVASEYQEAFDAHGTLTRPIELEEARLLVVEARALDEKLALGLGPQLDHLQAGLDTTTADAGFVPQLERMQAAVAARTGVQLDTGPPEPPSAERGARVYAELCARCHGPGGAGDGPDAADLEVPPASFTDLAFMRAETPRDFFNIITLGRRRSGMPEWGDVLSVQQRWDVVRFVWTLHGGPRQADVAAFATACAGCHGAAGNGLGPQVVDGERPPDLSTVESLAERSDMQLFTVASRPGHTGGAELPESVRWEAVAGLRDLSLGGSAQVEVTASEAMVTFAEVRRLVQAAAAAHGRAEPTAPALATDAYMRFEPVERQLSAIEPALVTDVEQAFVLLRTRLGDPGATASDVDAAVAGVQRTLDAAEQGLTTRLDTWTRFAQAVTIIVREGFEVVLIVGALLTWVRRSGQTAMLRPIQLGSAAGLVASLATAVLLLTVLRSVPGLADAFEGIAFLLAAVVLFWVSYWLISKAEADRWQRYIRGKVEGALARGSAGALAAAGFLAVYREGCETVLFYQALLAGAPAGDVAVFAGFGVGLGLLALLYRVFQRVGNRVPLGTFFLVTGALLYGMAIVFAGKGVFELQEVSWLPLTPLTAVPTIPALGVFPSLEAVIAQGLMLALLVVALVVTLVRRARRPPIPSSVGERLDRAAGT